MENDRDAFALAIAILAILVATLAIVLTNYHYEMSVADNPYVQTDRLYDTCAYRCDNAVPDADTVATLECLASCNVILEDLCDIEVDNL